MTERLSHSGGFDPDSDVALPGRVIGRVGGAGLRIVVLAALHGNEPDGVAAVRAVLEALEQVGSELSGSLVAFIGNRRAYALGQRYLERDLNRGWGDPNEPQDGTARERAELTQALLAEVEHASADGEQMLVIDLHSTSGPGVPFAIPQPGGAKGIAARAIEASGLPQVGGLAERIDNALLSWLQERDIACMVMEGGQAGRPETSTALEAALWRVLDGLIGPLPPSANPEAEDSLQSVTQGLPRALEVHYVQDVPDGSDFLMDRPGGQLFRGFDAVAKGERLAQDKHGPIVAPFAGYLLLPLYQGQGREGFFLATEVERPA